MYEAELNKLTGRQDELPAEVRTRFAESNRSVVARTLLPWGEHCTECNWPTCYTTCELYTPRQDGACRLFVDGMVRIDLPGALNGYVLKMRFKRWAKLWTVGNIHLVERAQAEAREQRNMRTGAVARVLPLPAGFRGRVLRKVSYLRRRAAEDAVPSPETPDGFLFECYNPNPRAYDITVILRPRGGDMQAAYQSLVSVPPGYKRAVLPMNDIAQRIDLARPFEVEIVPNECDDTVLYFGALDFFRERTMAAPPPAAGKAATWKCIVWDLDNTLWDGTLIEDGMENIRVRQSVVDVIKETDKRGILHSIASKNNPEDAMKVLRMSGLDDLFLHPQIGWQPKSQSIARIVQSLNIGIDTIAFVDDQPFEREEVRAACPDVTVIDAAETNTIPGRPECQVPVTEASRQRRHLYQQDQQRKVASTGFGDDYMSFLKACEIRLEIEPLNQENLHRVYELAQRTNQMNFSGNRYPESELNGIIRSDRHETFVMKCVDRFGSYGIVGFSVVERREPRLLDLMFSCRIQSKRVEHAFLGFLLGRFAGKGTGPFLANYRPTAKNEASGKVFAELGFEEVETKEGVVTLAFPQDREVPEDGIVTISDRTGK